jgi:hypothetical protein
MAASVSKPMSTAKKKPDPEPVPTAPPLAGAAENGFRVGASGWAGWTGLREWVADGGSGRSSVRVA